MRRSATSLRAAGHTWPVPLHAPPVMVQAMESRRMHVGLSGGIRYDTWVLDYCFTSAGLCRAVEESAEWLPREKNVGHLYRPGTVYWEDSRPVDRLLESAHVRFNCDHPDLHALVEEGRGFCRFLDPDGKLGDLLCEAARAGAVLGDAGYWRATAVLHSIFYYLLSARPSGPNTRTVVTAEGASGLPELVLAVREFLTANLAERVRLEDIARHAHVSVSTLSHSYRAETGETPMNTLTRMRLAAAKEMLIRGQRLKSVALQTGFCDEYHFSKAFKRAEGISPVAWAKTRSTFKVQR